MSDLIKNNGVMSVDKWALVKVVYADGSTETDFAGAFRWDKKGTAADIVKFTVIDE